MTTHLISDWERIRTRGEGDDSRTNYVIHYMRYGKIVSDGLVSRAGYDSQLDDMYRVEDAFESLNIKISNYLNMEY